MKRAKLDRSEAFSTIHGDDEYGRAFEQGGKYFDIEGNEVLDTDPVRTSATVVAVGDKTAAADGDVDEQVAKLTADLEAAKAELAKAGDDLAEATTKLSELEGENAEKTAALEKVKLELASVREELDALKKAHKPAKSASKGA